MNHIKNHLNQVILFCDKDRLSVLSLTSLLSIVWAKTCQNRCVLEQHTCSTTINETEFHENHSLLEFSLKKRNGPENRKIVLCLGFYSIYSLVAHVAVVHGSVCVCSHWCPCSSNVRPCLPPISHMITPWSDAPENSHLSTGSQYNTPTLPTDRDRQTETDRQRQTEACQRKSSVVKSVAFYF